MPLLNGLSRRRRISARPTQTRPCSNMRRLLVERLEDRSLFAADVTFGAGGLVLTDFLGDAPDWAADVVLQPDGKLIAVGQASGLGGVDFGVARYLPDGALDPSFGDGGLVTTDFGIAAPAPDRARAVALQPDGKIIVAGVTGMFMDADIALARYNSDGSLDMTFGAAGRVRTNSGFVDPAIIGLGGTPDADEAFDVLVQPDGKIVAVGVAEALTLYGVHSDFLVARYLSDGSLDTTFAPDETRDVPGSPPPGVTTTNFGGLGAPVVATVPDRDDSGAPLGTYHTFTTTTFSDVLYGMSIPEGYALNDLARAVALAPDGTLTVVGSTQRFASMFGAAAIARYRADGSLAQQLVVDLGPGLDEAAAVALRDDGWVVAGGASTVGGAPDVALVRYTTAGLPDPLFGGDGVAIYSPTIAGDTVKALAQDASGRLLVAGVAGFTAALGDESGLDVGAPPRLLGGDLLIARILADGSLDRSYDGDGLRVIDLGDVDEQVNAVALQADGRLVVAGQGLNPAGGTGEDFVLMRELLDDPVMPNRPPVAVADHAATTDRVAIDIDVLANDRDPDGDTLTFTALSTATSGSAAIVGGVVHYVPAPDFGGTATLSYSVADGRGGVAEGTVVIEVADTTPPRVLEVAVRGLAWTLAPQAIPVDAGAQLRPLPWVGLQQVLVRFSEPVVAPLETLRVFGVAVPEYGVVGVAYDPAVHVATWTLARVVDADRLLLDLSDAITDASGNHLDGEWHNPRGVGDTGGAIFPSGDGVAGGRFQFRIDVLPGDVDQSGEVGLSDLLTVLRAIRSGAPTALADLDGDGAVGMADLLRVATRLRRRLPVGEPRRR